MLIAAIRAYLNLTGSAFISFRIRIIVVVAKSTFIEQLIVIS